LISGIRYDIAEKCASVSCDVIYVADTAAEIGGLTSCDGRFQYAGDQKLENDYLKHICDALSPFDIVIERCGAKMLDTRSAVYSIIQYSETSFGLRALRNYFSWVPQERWRPEISKRNLMPLLREKLEMAYGLGIIDSIQYRNWTADRAWQHYDLNKLFK